MIRLNLCRFIFTRNHLSRADSRIGPQIANQIKPVLRLMFATKTQIRQSVGQKPTIAIIQADPSLTTAKQGNQPKLDGPELKRKVVKEDNCIGLFPPESVQFSQIARSK